MAQKMEGKGGELGDVWDDGVHEGVRKVYVGHGQDCIAFVKFEYVDGSQMVIGDEHGNQTLQVTEEFEVDADDYIVSGEVFLTATRETVVALKFVTYKGKTNEIVKTSPETKYVLQGGKIVGFHGRSSDVLHSLGAYVSFPSTPELLGKWIKVEQKGEAPGLRCSHATAQVGNKIYSFGGELTPNEPIDKDLYVFALETRTWSISPATGDVPHLSCLGVRMVSIGSTLYVFGGRDASRKYNGFYSFDTITNDWKLLTPVEEGPTPRSFHSMAADENNVYVFGGVISADRVNTIDAYSIVDQKWVQCAPPGESITIRGGAGLEVVQGKVWVLYGFTGYELGDIHYYDPIEDKWTQVETFGEKPTARSVFASAVVGKHIVIFGGEIAMDLRGHAGPGTLIGGTFALNTETLKWFRLDKPGEEEETPEIRGWSASTSGTMNGKKGLVMLCGKAQSNGRFDDLFFYGVDSTSTPAKMLPAVGGDGGTAWNDGVHDGVRKVHVGQGQDGISCINVVYEKGSEEVEGGEHGNKTLLGFETFEVDEDDYIIEVHVSYDKIFGQESDVITSITFYTFKGKASPPYGLETGNKIVLKEENGGKLVGFHGRSGEALHALGAYFATTTTAKKLPAVGLDGGTAWDDGAYDGVKKVYVGQAQDGISVVKFVYDKGAEEIIGDEHGNSTLLGFEEFVLDYPSEYITSVEGTYDQIFGSDSAVVTMLRFKTNKQTSAPFGIEAGTPFELKEEGYKIVGFHGKVSELLHQFGVHVLPIGN